MSALIRTPLRPVMLACAIALCSHANAQAADDPIIAQSTVTLSGLSFQLIDLTPGDGIAPSLSFQTQGVIDTSNSVYDEASDSWLPNGPTYSNSLLPSTPVNYTSPDGLSTFTSTSNSVTLQSQLALSQVLPPLTPPDGTGAGHFAYGETLSSVDLWTFGGPYDMPSSGFTLGAGTSLVLRGTLSAEMTFDSTAVRSALAATGYHSWALYGTLVGLGRLQLGNQLYDADGNFFGASVQQSDRLYFDGRENVSHFNDMDNSPLNLSTSQDFEFTVDNFGESDGTGVVDMYMRVNSDVRLYAERFSVIPPAIPEPSTYALMGLGLVGVTAVARRRRHAS